MKNLLILLVLSQFILISCNSTNSKPSIKDNSVRKSTPKIVDYSNTDHHTLFKHITAHYDLGQYKLGKEKLTYLIDHRPDLVDSMDLNMLKSKFDSKLLEIQVKEEAIAETERRSRMPNASKKMRSYKLDNLTYYVDKTSPEFDSKECFYAYYTINNAGILNLNFKIRYIDTQWLNIENYLITVDQLDYTLTGTIVKSETKGKKIYKHELLDIPINSLEKFKILNAIASGSKVTALYVGESSYKTRKITQPQQLAIRNVIDAYFFMGGTNFKNDDKPKYTSNEN